MLDWLKRRKRIKSAVLGSAAYDPTMDALSPNYPFISNSDSPGSGDNSSCDTSNSFDSSGSCDSGGFDAGGGGDSGGGGGGGDF
jgi:hypothetical protein